MAYPPMPRDPNDPYQPAPPQAPYPGGAPPQQPQVVYVQAPAPQAVHAKRGMSFTGHGFNWTLTIFTCGMWLPVYWCWWAAVRSVQAWRNHRNRKKHFKVYG